MSPNSGQERTSEFSLTEGEFQFICKLVYDSTGIVLGDRKREMVYRRLMRRLREVKLPSFSAYCELLKNDEQELPAFINSITTNLTSFFRENHHFEFLKYQVVPQLLECNRDHRIRIWSAACSTGEEPYSIAISLMEAMGQRINSWDAKVLATDLDSDCVAKAKSGVYRSDRIKDIDPQLQKRWFKKGKSENSDLVKVNSDVQQLITFKALNLLHEWPIKGPFDVIFCRNVFIYFDRPTQKQLIDRYHAMLKPGGYLMLGHSESLPKDCGGFKVMGRTIFQKI